MAKNRKVKENHGSRIHILNLVERPDFTDRLSELLWPTGATIQATDVWMPKGCSDPKEARNLSHILPILDWKTIRDWWLIYGSRTPDWDLASSCTIQGQRGLVIAEAKAHVGELKEKDICGSGNCKNREQIGKALDETGQALCINISRDMRLTHYQLANRIAFSWKIASMGIPIILVYLGFLGDKTWPDDLFEDNDHWERELRKYMDKYIPIKFTEHWIDCGEAQMQMIVRSLPVE